MTLAVHHLALDNHVITSRVPDANTLHSIKLSDEFRRHLANIELSIAYGDMVWPGLPFGLERWIKGGEVPHSAEGIWGRTKTTQPWVIDEADGVASHFVKVDNGNT